MTYIVPEAPVWEDANDCGLVQLVAAVRPPLSCGERMTKLLLLAGCYPEIARGTRGIIHS